MLRSAEVRPCALSVWGHLLSWLLGKVETPSGLLVELGMKVGMKEPELR